VPLDSAARDSAAGPTVMLTRKNLARFSHMSIAIFDFLRGESGALCVPLALDSCATFPARKKRALRCSGRRDDWIRATHGTRDLWDARIRRKRKSGNRDCSHFAGLRCEIGAYHVGRKNRVCKWHRIKQLQGYFVTLLDASGMRVVSPPRHRVVSAVPHVEPRANARLQRRRDIRGSTILPARRAGCNEPRREFSRTCRTLRSRRFRARGFRLVARVSVASVLRRRVPFNPKLRAMDFRAKRHPV
jgi:hypothetical protein